MEGNVCENSDNVKWDSCGEEDDDEVGEGGPSDDGETRACSDGAEDVGMLTLTPVLSEWLGGGGSPETEWRLGREAGGDMGGVGIFGLEKRFVAPTLRPASCSKRMRSAIEPPSFLELLSVF